MRDLFNLLIKISDFDNYVDGVIHLTTKECYLFLFIIFISPVFLYFICKFLDWIILEIGHIFFLVRRKLNDLFL